MKITKKDFDDDSCDNVFPCLLEYIKDSDPEIENDILLGLRLDGDFVDCLVLTNKTNLKYFHVGEFLSRQLVKHNIRYFHGEIVLKN